MKYEDFTIILPTLNEGGNIKELLEYLIKNYDGITIMLVDDGSTDRTKEIAEGFTKQHVTVFDRQKQHRERGLTNSIVDGILKSRSKYVIVMDADFQHPPEIVRSIAHRLTTGYELVIAIRAKVEDWPLFRKIISRSLIYLGKFVLFAERKQSSNDIFSGFFGVRRETFLKYYEKNKKRFVGDGYKVLFDFLKCVNKGMISIYEIPYTFVGRKEGKSKAGMKQGMAVLRSYFS